MTEIKNDIQNAIGREFEMQLVKAAMIPFPPLIKGPFEFMEEAGVKALPFNQDVANLIGICFCL